MNCESTDLVGWNFKRCTREATTHCWCPTWVNAQRGPMYMCEHHARNFKPKFNRHATDGEFYWDADADEKFQTIGPKPNGVNRL